ncbi:hypothetical protein ES703_20980 [subsurface metagenome]
MISVFKHSLMITSFVFVMMLVIEYINILTKGVWQERLTKHRWGQYTLAALLGVLPGCLGAFAVVAMYSHGILTVGAVITAMIATSGDEAFVMFAMVPKQALFINGVLFTLGIVVGGFTDFVMRKSKKHKYLYCKGLEIHDEEQCVCFPYGQIIQQWRKCSAVRGILVTLLSIIIVAVITGQLGPPTWTWIRITLLIVSGVSLFIVATAPDHFLDKHLWYHVVIKHIPWVFLWTLGALIVLYVLTEHLHMDLEITSQKGKWIVLLVACLIGLIPESGPHLVFVTLYARGIIPISVLLANSIVQDGHGMLPMLANSRRTFFNIKGVNFVAGILFGAITMAMGF